MTINIADILLGLVILVGVAGGWARGFVWATLDLVTLLLALAAAFLGYRYPAAWLEQFAPTLGVWIAPVSFVVLFFLAHAVLWAVTGRMARALPPRLHHHGVNRFLGLAPGLVNGTLHAVVAAILLLVLPLGPLSQWARDGALASRLAAPAEWVEARLSPIFDPAIQRTLQALTVKPDSRTSIALRARVADPRPRPDLEARMLELVNAERARQGLKPVSADPELTQVARAHSRDMFARGYFSHYTPEGRDLGDRLRTGRVLYLAAGENLALAPTLAGAHRGLMNSPGHRANILRPQFGRLGVGVLDGGVHGLMVTQNFRN